MSSTAIDPTTSATPDPRRWQALGLVCIAFFMSILDVSIVNVALPSIGRSLHFSETGLQWVVTAYAITFGGFLLLGGRAADLLGRRRMFMVGVALFSLASLVCGLSGSTGVLVAARAVQGVGGPAGDEWDGNVGARLLYKMIGFALRSQRA